MAPLRAQILGSKNFCPWPTPLDIGPLTENRAELFFFHLFFPHELEAKKTLQESYFVPRTDHNWVILPSTKALQSYTRELIEKDKKRRKGNSSRKYGKAAKDTHYIETADLAINLHSNLKYPTEVIAFLAFAHDLIEDFETTPKKIVKRCWKGDRIFIPLLLDILDKLTDDEKLRTPATEETQEQKRVRTRLRHREQIKIANEDPTGLVAHIRACDKLSSLIRDFSTLLGGEMPFGNEEKFRDYFEQRKEVMGSLNRVSPRIKRWYARLLAKVERGLAYKRKTGAFPKGRNDFLDPLSYVSPSTPEIPFRIGRRDIGAPVI